jgi:hypothetical protein
MPALVISVSWSVPVKVNRVRKSVRWSQARWAMSNATAAAGPASAATRARICRQMVQLAGKTDPWSAVTVCRMNNGLPATACPANSATPAAGRPEQDLSRSSPRSARIVSGIVTSRSTITTSTAV